MRSLVKEARQRERAVVVNILRKADIVLSTCVGAGSRLLKDLQFDMVVIDEAALTQLEARYAARGRVPGERNRRQVLRPVGGRCLPNDNGTAPGLEAVLDDCRVVVLPR